MEVVIKSDGYWLWFKSKEKPPYIITGKYLFFSDDIDTLKGIAIDEISNNGFHLAKINLYLIGKNTEHVLCLYYKDDSRKNELTKKYQGKVNYRFWKSNKDTRRGKYSEEFLSKLTSEQRREFEKVRGEIRFVDGEGRLIMRQ